MPKEPSASEFRCMLLLHATAEALAMPEAICLMRRCRRAHACLFTCGRRFIPGCVRELPPWQRALFDELAAIVVAIHDNVRPPRPSDDPERRELEAAAIAIITAVLPRMPDIARRFSEWRKRYAAPPEPRAAPPPPPAPPIDTAALLREMKAELARDGIVLARDD